jgi:hypothetical protein
LSEKTLKRLQLGGCEPHYNTLRSFYAYFFKVVPGALESSNYLVVKQLIEKSIFDKSEYGSIDYEDLLKENKVFRTLFLYSRCGKFSYQWVEREYGKYGLEILENMLTAGILIEESYRQYTQGPQTLNKGPQALIKIMQDLLEHVSPERLAMVNFNQAFYVIENVDEATKNKAIDLMQKFKVEMIDLLINHSQPGTERLFVSGFLDTLKALPGDQQ